MSSLALARAAADEKGGAVLRMLRTYVSLVVPAGAPFLTPSSSGNSRAPAPGVVTPLPFTPTNVTLLPLRRRLQQGEGEQQQQQQPVDVSTTLPRPTWRTDPLMAALRAYLQQYAYGVATTPQLLDTLEKHTGAHSRYHLLPIRITSCQRRHGRGRLDESWTPPLATTCLQACPSPLG